MTPASLPSTRLRRLLAVLLLAPLVVALKLGASDADSVEWPIPEFAEPSGIVYHPARKSLFIVGDEGDIGEVTLDGQLLRQAHLGGDLEGVTVDPSTGHLYVAREGHEVIFEVRADDFRLLRRFTIDRSFQGDPNYLKRGGDGIEGITFVPDAGDPEGGKLWAVNQYDPPVLIRLGVAIRTSTEKFQSARVEQAVPVDSAPLSGVTWNAASREFFIVSALWRKAVVVDASGKTLRSVRIPGFMPEGMTRLPDGRFVIAQDSGGLLLWSPPSDPFRGEVDAGPPVPTSPSSSDNEKS